jgi:glycosyltransferase involved in cell wall biosynthesis
MNIIGLTRVRNESEIITETLDHMATFCNKIIVYDDCSTDNTVQLCRSHIDVHSVICGTTWDHNRKRAEWQNRSLLLREGKKHAKPNDWFVYMDADERIEFDWVTLKYINPAVIGFRMKLFDYYITPEDIDLHYSKRQWLGPEYRNILMLFRNLPTLDYSSPDQREVHLRHNGTVISQGYVKHYGKAISVKQWEDTCNYYSTFFPKYSAKWQARKGKSVHIKSSFGNPLILWDQKDEKGIPLTPEIEKHNIYETVNNKPLA